MSVRAGPFVALWNPGLLSWGTWHFNAEAASRGYSVLVLTDETPDRILASLRASGLEVLYCPFVDNPHLEQAMAAVDHCAPVAAARIAAGGRVLVTDAAGENRVSLMTARIRHLVTGESGQTIVEDMLRIAGTWRNAQGGISHPFTNGVFGREARSWPAGSPLGSSSTGKIVAGVGIVAALVAIGYALSR